MTPQQYQEWIKTRGESGTWGHDMCVQADALIRETTLTNAGNWLDEYTPPKVAEYMKLMLKHHYGSGETDEFLQSINAYPDWMEKT
jgi:hypothetical protein